MKQIGLTAFLTLLLVCAGQVQGQRGTLRSGSGGGNNVLYGDIKVHESQTSSLKPLTLDVLLYTEGGDLVSRQTVSGNGRYRFNNINDGRFQIVVEVENSEVARFKVDFSSPLKGEIRKDIEFEWRESSGTAKTGVVNAADKYNRPAKNEAIFSKASEAMENKHYDVAISLLRQIVESDAGDFPAWNELGTAYFIQKDFAEAEKAYTQAISKHPEYALALISLGRLRIAQKDYAGASEVLTQAVKVEPTSAQANYFLGEAYLQLKKGSVAVSYLNEAIKLDPIGMADAHLRLAALYNAVGWKDKAVAEYEQFLKKKPDYPDRKKLEQYIAANKKP
jgi:cytochrome c-type biogenesis protein CcmH/NrfG